MPPDGTPAPGGTGVTVAVKVTGWPNTAVGDEEVTEVVESALITFWVVDPSWH